MGGPLAIAFLPGMGGPLATAPVPGMGEPGFSTLFSCLSRVFYTWGTQHDTGFFLKYGHTTQQTLFLSLLPNKNWTTNQLVLSSLIHSFSELGADRDALQLTGLHPGKVKFQVKVIASHPLGF